VVAANNRAAGVIRAGVVVIACAVDRLVQATDTLRARVDRAAHAVIAILCCCRAFASLAGIAVSAKVAVVARRVDGDVGAAALGVARISSARLAVVAADRTTFTAAGNTYIVRSTGISVAARHLPGG
jgi:hypothetical protein